MLRHISHIILVLLLCLCAAACSVKEPRGDCPSFLTTTVAAAGLGTDGSEHSLTVWSYSKSGSPATFVDGSRFTREGGSGSVVSRVYPRQQVLLFFSSVPPQDNAVTSAAEGQMPMAYISCDIVDCFEDEVHHEFHSFNKQWCTLTLQLDEHTMPLREEIEIRITGGSNGFRIPSMELTKEKFHFSGSFDSKGCCKVRVPRQNRKDTRINLSRNGLVPSNYDFYTLSTREGMDWSKESLDDLDCTISLNSTGSTLVLRDWDIKEFNTIIF